VDDARGVRVLERGAFRAPAKRKVEQRGEIHDANGTPARRSGQAVDCLLRPSSHPQAGTKSTLSCRPEVTPSRLTNS
jgi:hypothetical protein